MSTNTKHGIEGSDGRAAVAGMPRPRAAAPPARRAVIGGREPLHQRLEGRRPFLGDAEMELAGDRLKVLGSGRRMATVRPSVRRLSPPCLLAHPAGVNVDR